MIWQWWLSLLYALAVVVAGDLYEVLGVSKKATDREIKKAYRALSRQYHPDKNPGNEDAHNKFIEIGNAYEVLSDKEQRAKYDRYGEAGLKGQHHQDPMDIFSHFFGGGFGGFNRGRPRGPDATTEMYVSLSDIYKGRVIEINVDLQGICDECDGSGSADGKTDTCPKCRGQGSILTEHQIAPGIVQRLQYPCDKCNGKGSVIAHPCKQCKGSRVMRERRPYNVFIDAGAPRSWNYVLEGEADQSPDWEAGNLIVHLTQSPQDHFGYRRRGVNLFRKEMLSSKQAQNGGWQREITRLDLDSTITLSRKKGVSVQNGEIEVIEDEGMPIQNGSGHGKLYIEYVVIPQHSGSHDEL